MSFYSIYLILYVIYTFTMYTHLVYVFIKISILYNRKDNNKINDKNIKKHLKFFMEFINIY